MPVIRRAGLAVLLSLACARPEPIQNDLHFAIDSSTSIPVARLSQSVNQLAVDSTLARPLDLDLQVASPDLGDIAAVWEYDGRPLVLNRRDRIVVRIDSAGAIADTLARPGEGPGEISVPWGLATLGSRLLITQVYPIGNVLTLVPLDGGAALSKSPPVAADWTMMVTRSPNLMLDFPTQAGIEDWTRRLVVLDDSSFVLAMRDDTLVTAPSQVRLLRFRADFTLRDTLGIMPAPPTVPLRGQSGGPTPEGDELFVSRPWFVAGSGWTAMGHGDSASGIVTFASGQQLRIEWPFDPRPISERDRLDASHWAAVYVTRAFPEARNQFVAMTAEQRADAEKQFLGVIPFAAKVPQLSAAFGAGHCLWLAGFAPNQFIDGTSLTLVGINLKERRLVGPVRVPGVDLRIKHVTPRSIYLKRINEDDEPVLVRYLLPTEAAC